MKKLGLLVAAGVGYVLGTRAGRERYDQIKANAEKVSRSPAVQNAATRASDAVSAKAPIVGELAQRVRARRQKDDQGGTPTYPNTSEGMPPTS